MVLVVAVTVTVTVIVTPVAPVHKRARPFLAPLVHGSEHRLTRHRDVVRLSRVLGFPLVYAHRVAAHLSVAS